MQNSSQPRTTYHLVIAFLVSFIAVGLPYWHIPYANVSLPSTLYGPGLLVVGGSAATVCAFGAARLLTAILVVGSAIPATILVRVSVETTRDPTSHNLWPFEVIIAAVVGMLCSSAGAIVGSLSARLARRKNTT